MKCNNFEVYMYDHDSDPNHKEQLLTDNEVQLQDLLVKFEEARGDKFTNDRMMLG